MKKIFYSNGKLLLTGEYVVLDGATALAIPTKFGQSLTVETTSGDTIDWESFDNNNKSWFSIRFKETSLSPLHTESQAKDDASVRQLTKILQKARFLNPSFLTNGFGYKVTTKLDFPVNWGLGSSSTLINNIAQWAQVDAFQLLDESFGGSGYDIAAAQNDSPILYTRKEGNPKIQSVRLPWEFTAQLFFVHLNQKQDSKEGIARYTMASQKNDVQIDIFSEISKDITSCTTLSEFKTLLLLHEELISDIIELPTVKKRLFPDFPGLVKSLGAWGGDFVLATGMETEQDYFRKKGYNTIIPFTEMIL